MLLTLCKTRFADDVRDDDYMVVSDGIEIGCMLKQPIPMERPNWFWGIILTGQPQPSNWRGSVATLDDDKAAFKARYEEINAAR